MEHPDLFRHITKMTAGRTQCLVKTQMGLAPLESVNDTMNATRNALPEEEPSPYSLPIFTRWERISPSPPRPEDPITP